MDLLSTRATFPFAIYLYFRGQHDIEGVWANQLSLLVCRLRTMGFRLGIECITMQRAILDKLLPTIFVVQ